MDKWDAMTKIRELARQANLAVSIVTVSDVLALRGIDAENDEPTPEQIDKVTSSWEWNHYGDNWSDWFENIDL